MQILAIATIVMTLINISAGLLHTKLFGNNVVLLPINSLYKIVLISIKSAILEEIIFRATLITLIINILLKNNVRKNTMSKNRMFLVSVILASFAFAIIHPLNGLFLAFIFGIILGYIYLYVGLIDVIIIHSLTNMITSLYFYFN
jgi:membrane protease YdiL (CAAX protease family)